MSALDEADRASFTSRRRAIELFVEYPNMSVSSVASQTGIDPKALYRMIERCLAKHADGRIYGFRAAIPYARLKRYERIHSIDREVGAKGSGLAGAFGLLLGRYPSLEKFLPAEAKMRRELITEAREVRRSVKRIHAVAVFVVTLAISRAGVAITAHLLQMPTLAARMPFDLMFGTGCALLLASFFANGRQPFRRAQRLRLLDLRLNRRFGGASVAVLATHFPFMMFAVAGASAVFGVPVAGSPSMAVFALFIATVEVVFIYACCFARLAHTVSRAVRAGPLRFA